MTHSEASQRSIFCEALERPAPEERAAYLDRACGDDAELRARVEALLDAHGAAGGFLRGPSAADTPTINMPVLAEGPGTHIGPYKLLQQIGEGGFGVVFMAEQTEPVARRVALKVIKPGMDSRQVIARFEAERQALAMMDHPNIAKVLDAGTTDSGWPYFVMELVKGVPITRYCDEKHLTPRERLDLFVPVCQAVQHAHHKGIIHRDLKPSNVLVALFDGKPVPKVIDFGVAKATGARLTDRTMFTELGQIVGTLEYMSPEQAELNQLDVDTRSDIYSLGVLLYELLTGTTPFERKRLQQAALIEWLRIIREDEPQKPSTRLSTTDELPSIAANRGLEPKRLSGLVRGELDWIVMKALEKDRGRRYETANGFAQDVQRYLNDEAVAACPPSAAYRFRKFARRNRGVLAAASLIVAALTLSVAALAVGNIRVTRERNAKAQALVEKTLALGEKQAALAKATEQERLATANAAEARQQRTLADAQAARAREQELLARQRFYASQMNLAQQAWEAGDQPRVLELLESQRPHVDEPDLRSFEWFYLWHELHTHLRMTLRGSAGFGASAVYSPDGKTIATVDYSGLITLWDARMGKELERLQSHVGAWDQLAFSPDGKLLAHTNGPEGYGPDAAVTLWNLETKTPSVIERTGEVRCVAFSPDGKYLATAPEHRRQPGVTLWNVATRQEVVTLEAVTPVLSVAFAPDGKSLAACHGWLQTGGLRVWDVSHDPPEQRHDLPWSHTVAFAADGKSLLTHDPWKGIKQWDMVTGRERSIGNGSNISTALLAVSPDGRYIAFNGHPSSVLVREIATDRQEIFTHPGHVDAVAFSPDSSALAVGSVHERAVKVWSLSDEGPLNLQQSAGYRSFAFSPDGTTVSGIHGSGAVRLWNVADGVARASIPGEPGLYGSVAFSPDGRFVAFAQTKHETRTEDRVPGVVTVCQASTGAPVAALHGHTRGVCRVAFSPDGGTLASAGFEGTVRLWDVATWRQRASLTPAPHAGGVGTFIWALGFSPDGRTLIVARQWGHLFLFDAATGEQKKFLRESFHGRFQSTLSLAFSPDGRLFATGAEDGVIRVRDTATGELRGRLAGPASHVASLAFFPDGRTLVAGGQNGMVTLWDVNTRQERFRFQGGTHVAVSPDGLTLIAAGKIYRASTSPEALAFRPENSPDDPLSLGSRIATGDAHWEAGRLEEAERAYRDALERALKLTEHLHAEASYRAHQARAAWSLQLLLRMQGKTSEADALRQDHGAEIDIWLNSHNRAAAGSLNNQAWRLCTAPERNNGANVLAVELARRAVAAAPNLGTYQNTLGVALYRAGEFAAAEKALKQSMQLRHGGDANDWFFLAMTRHRLGDAEAAAAWYRAACLHTDRHAAHNDELRRFRAEARELLGRPELDVADPVRDLELLSALIAAHPDVATLRRLRDKPAVEPVRPESAADIIARLDQLPQATSWYSERMTLCRDVARNEALFAAMQKLRPDSADLWIARGQVLALEKKWNEAAASFEPVIEQRTSTGDAFQFACLQLLTDQTDAYRAFCQKLITTQAGEVDDPNVAFRLARTSILVPEMVADPEQVVSWAERAVSEERHPWHLHPVGAACYRAGQYERAAELLQESTNSGWAAPGHALNALFLAMVHQRQGNFVAAAEWLNRARELMDTANDPPPPDWLEYHVLLREAEALIESGAGATGSQSADLSTDAVAAPKP
ncbi:MAG TPA: protein kinase [Planctomycetaceae bacterium]|nr:protein kinase [Planctomycetaceae bacterium]